MEVALDWLSYRLSHPEAIIYEVSTALLYPVLFAEVIALAVALIEAGRFTVELWRRRWPRSVEALKALGEEVKAKLQRGELQDAVTLLGTTHPRSPHSRFFLGLEGPADLERTILLKRLDEFERRAARKLERTRVLVRIGPSLGLMGTLIPISPALIALAQGDIQTLSSSLIIAFSTTVDGLFIGLIAYIISAVRDRLYARDMSDIEYILEVSEL